MKTINDDPDDFFERGGWDFLDDNNSDEEAQMDEEDEDDEAYDPTDSEMSADESESEYSDDEVSESDESDGKLDLDYVWLLFYSNLDVFISNRRLARVERRVGQGLVGAGGGGGRSRQGPRAWHCR